ncbi:LysR family transcriptional regulator [Thioalkalivibrio sp.]|uniref:LysR family transcriptional regulator n=1 Tax=Thioalkalivibrio sp. TaxID=2093813 RepID=UPI003976ED0B
MPKVTLEQWRMLKAVVDAGGFAKAAELVHKSPSSINHAVQKLQIQLGVPLLEVRGRKAELTAAGAALLRRAGHLLDEAREIEGLADTLTQGVETELALAVDQVVPQPVLIDVLEGFSRRFPNTRVQLHETMLGGGADLLHTGQVDLLIGTGIPDGVLAEPLGQVCLICVAHPRHRLATGPGQLSLRDLRHSREVVVRDATTEIQVSDANWLEAEQRWIVDQPNTALGIVEAGFAYAWLPECLVRESLDRGRLVVLDLELGGTCVIPFSLAYADRDQAGVAAVALGQTLILAFAERGPEADEMPDWWSLARCGSRVKL